MPKVQSFPDLGKIDDHKEFIRQSSPVIKNIADVVNGKLEFDHNLNTQTVTVKFTTANADTIVTHNLNKVGVHYMIGKKSVACDIFDGSQAATKTKFYLQSSVAPATVTLILA